jgi:surfactin synthase thioesterase subunit
MYSPPAEQIIWEIQKGSRDEEIWLFPPIMGMGLIFNTLQLPAGIRAFSFHYPDTFGDKGCGNISDILRCCRTARESLGPMPESVTLLGYSMGGLLAYEAARWLESQSVRVNKLIILDKTAQPEAPEISKDSAVRQELLEIIGQITKEKDEFSRIHAYLEKHQGMIEAYQQNGKISCPVDVYYCPGGFAFSGFAKWERFTSGSVRFLKVENASHYSLPDIWNRLGIFTSATG